MAMVVGALLGLAIAGPAQARDDSISSFDGTRIVLSFFPADNLPAGRKAPTVLFGRYTIEASGRRADATKVRVTKRVVRRAPRPRR
jgi:ABC-2 type transport system ATP-binding protein